MAEGNSEQNGQQDSMVESKCATCAIHEKAKENPNSWTARFWRFHTRFCPGWKAYKKELSDKGLPAPTV